MGCSLSRPQSITVYTRTRQTLVEASADYGISGPFSAVHDRTRSGPQHCVARSGSWSSIAVRRHSAGSSTTSIESVSVSTSGAAARFGAGILSCADWPGSSSPMAISSGMIAQRPSSVAFLSGERFM